MVILAMAYVTLIGLAHSRWIRCICRFLLKESEARQIVAEVREAVSQWRQVFREAGISQTDIHTLTHCFSVADEAERIRIAVASPVAGEPEDGGRGSNCPGFK